MTIQFLKNMMTFAFSDPLNIGEQLGSFILLHLSKICQYSELPFALAISLLLFPQLWYLLERLRLWLLQVPPWSWHLSP